MFQSLLEKTISGQNLSEEESESLVSAIMDRKLSDIQTSAILVALRVKGESIEEITGTVRAMINKATRISVETPTLVDTCGTGGDMSKTFNVSTTVAFVVASAGIPVAKHGNKSVSSKSGSADLLEEFGVAFHNTSEEVAESIRKVGIGFIFAPYFHSSMRNVAHIRRELKTRTIFNIVGPLSNPAPITHQLIGVYDKNLILPIARVLKSLGRKGAMVVHGDGLDELSVCGSNTIAQLKENGEIITYTLSPEDLGLKRRSVKEIQGGSPSENRRATIEILSGKKDARRDMVLLNSAAVFLITGITQGFKEGISLAADIIDSGLAIKKLKEFVQASREITRKGGVSLGHR